VTSSKVPDYVNSRSFTGRLRNLFLLITYVSLASLCEGRVTTDSNFYNYHSQPSQRTFISIYLSSFSMIWLTFRVTSIFWCSFDIVVSVSGHSGLNEAILLGLQWEIKSLRVFGQRCKFRDAPRSPLAEPVISLMPVLSLYFGFLGNHGFRGEFQPSHKMIG
jgi:hypothetical protein